MQYVNGKLGKEVGRLVGWRHGIWSRRYTAILVSNEEKAQVARLRYLLGHGVKEFLVEHAMDWPGVNSVRAILEGKPLTGYWFDRKAEYAARNGWGYAAEVRTFAAGQSCAVGSGGISILPGRVFSFFLQANKVVLDGSRNR